MSKLEIVQEIALIKQKLMNTEVGSIERNNLVVALIALYESALKSQH